MQTRYRGRVETVTLTAWERGRDKQLRYLERLKHQVRCYLGGECCRCGTTDDLHVHHVYGITWDRRAVSRWTRWRRYLAEAQQGIVVLLCQACHRLNGREQ